MTKLAGAYPDMAFGKPKSQKIRTEHLPGPIATSYRRIFTRHEPDVERLIFVLDTAEITARFLAAVALCTLRELVHKGKIERPLIPMGDPKARLRRPSFGLWMEILREGCRRLHGKDDWFENDAARNLARRVCGWVFNENLKTKGRPYALLDEVLVIRNRVHHPDGELDVASLCRDAERLLNEALKGLAFLEDFPMYVVKRINLRQRRLLQASYEHQCFLFQGEVDFPTAENDSRTWHTETNEVLIYCDESCYLNLDPMFAYIHADEIDTDKADGKGAVYPGLYIFGGFTSKSSGVVSDFLPCASSAKSFKTSLDAFRDETLTCHLTLSVNEMLGLLGAETEGAG